MVGGIDHASFANRKRVDGDESGGGGVKFRRLWEEDEEEEPKPVGCEGG